MNGIKDRKDNNVKVGGRTNFGVKEKSSLHTTKEKGLSTLCQTDIEIEMPKTVYDSASFSEDFMPEIEKNEKKKRSFFGKRK